MKDSVKEWLGVASKDHADTFAQIITGQIDNQLSNTITGVAFPTVTDGDRWTINHSYSYNKDSEDTVCWHEILSYLTIDAQLEVSHGRIRKHDYLIGYYEFDKTLCGKHRDIIISAFANDVGMKSLFLSTDEPPYKHIPSIRSLMEEGLAFAKKNEIEKVKRAIIEESENIFSLED